MRRARGPVSRNGAVVRLTESRSSRGVVNADVAGQLLIVGQVGEDYRGTIRQCHSDLIIRHAEYRGGAIIVDIEGVVCNLAGSIGNKIR